MRTQLGHVVQPDHEGRLQVLEGTSSHLLLHEGQVHLWQDEAGVGGTLEQAGPLCLAALGLLGHEVSLLPAVAQDDELFLGQELGILDRQLSAQLRGDLEAGSDLLLDSQLALFLGQALGFGVVALLDRFSEMGIPLLIGGDLRELGVHRDLGLHRRGDAVADLLAPGLLGQPDLLALALVVGVDQAADAVLLWLHDGGELAVAGIQGLGDGQHRSLELLVLGRRPLGAPLLEGGGVLRGSLALLWSGDLDDLLRGRHDGLEIGVHLGGQPLLDLGLHLRDRGDVLDLGDDQLLLRGSLGVGRFALGVDAGLGLSMGVLLFLVFLLGCFLEVHLLPFQRRAVAHA